MVELDLDMETAALRKKSPFGSRVVLIALILGSVFLALLIVGIFRAEDTANSPRWAIVVMCSVACLIVAAFMAAFFFRAKALIDRGVIVQAKLVDSIQVRQNVRLKLAVSYGGNDFQLPIYVPSGLAREVQAVGFLWMVIDPRSPKRAVPLWEFAGMKNLFEVASGNRGILDPK